MEDSDLNFDDRGYSFYKEAAIEQTQRQRNEFVCDLSHLGFIRAKGTDVVEFLHAQLTNDLKKLPKAESQLTGYCTPKGRLLSIFRVHHDNDGLVLQAHKDIVPSSIERLRKFILRAKVELSIDKDIDSFGVVGRQSSKNLEKIVEALPQYKNECYRTNGLTIICCSNSDPIRYQVIGAGSALQPLWRQIKKSCPKIGSWAWASIDIEQGLATIFPVTSEQFIPQMVNLDITQAVSFDKGCYPGQEIVARTHYLGKLKTRMILGSVSTTIPPMPGDKLYATIGEQSIGMIVDATPSSSGYDVLATARLENVQKGDLQLRDGSAAPVQLKQLPYQLENPEQNRGQYT